MTTATMNKSELMAPPVAETIQTRSMFIGLVGTVAAVAGPLQHPNPRISTPPTSRSSYSGWVCRWVAWRS